MPHCPEVTKDGDTLLAQNWDWYNEVKNCQVILKIGQREAKPALVTFTEAGQLAKIGMNAAGIGLVVNNLTSDQPRTGVPWIFLTRRILIADVCMQVKTGDYRRGVSHDAANTAL